MPALINFGCEFCGYVEEGFRGEARSCPNCSNEMIECFSPCTNFQWKCPRGLEEHYKPRGIANPVFRAELGLEDNGVRTTTDDEAAQFRREYSRVGDDPDFIKEVTEGAKERAKRPRGL